MSQRGISFQGQKFLVTGRNFMSQEEGRNFLSHDQISCQRQKCPGNNFFPQLEISCHRKKFLSQEETSIHSFVSEWMSGWEDHNLFMERRRCLRRPTHFDVTNDPLFIHADKLLFAAMNKYWRNNGNGE